MTSDILLFSLQLFPDKVQITPPLKDSTIKYSVPRHHGVPRASVVVRSRCLPPLTSPHCGQGGPGPMSAGSVGNVRKRKVNVGKTVCGKWELSSPVCKCTDRSLNTLAHSVDVTLYIVSLQLFIGLLGNAFFFSNKSFWQQSSWKDQNTFLGKN